MNKKYIERKMRNLVLRANTRLRSDVLALIKRAAAKETNKKAKDAFNVIIENAAVAAKNRIAICQDTGLPILFLEAGGDIKLSNSLIDMMQTAIETAYADYGFRASTVTGENTFAFSPRITHVRFNKRRNGIRVTLFPKGFGSENKSKLKMFNPTAAASDIDEFIVSAVGSAGCGACPPYIIGVGIGGTSDSCLRMAKEALLGSLARPGGNEKISRWQKELRRKINSLGIGPMGLGGKHTCLAVRIKTAPTHIAGLPVGVNISCHALRSATTTLSADSG